MLNPTPVVWDSQSALGADLAERITPAPRSLARFIPVCPPTPSKKTRRGIRQINPPLFKTQLPVVRQTLYQELYDRAGLLGDKLCAYQTSQGQTFPLIKQPTKSKSCGAGAVMMLVLGSFQKQNPQTALRAASRSVCETAVDFWNWYSMCQLTQSEEIQEVLARYFEIPTTIHQFVVSDFRVCLESFVNALSQSNHSLMLSITHPRVGGHWIILDEINMNMETVDIRDPYSGRAFRLSFNEFRQNLGEKDEFGFHIQHYLEISSLPRLYDGEVAPDAE